MKTKIWKVPFSYEKYGYIPVMASAPEEALAIAEMKLKDMSADEMSALTAYLDDSASIDYEDGPY